MKDGSKNSVPSDKSILHSYENFLLTEYNNIAQAHFNTKNSISSFFKHYLLIVSLPLPVFALLFRKASDINYELVHMLRSVIPFLFITISIVGIFVMLYIINLDLNASLYARAVNGIRYYFTVRSGLTEEEESRTRVLYIDNSKPQFTGFHSILFVVLTFAFIDSFYSVIAICNTYDSTEFPWGLLEWQSVLSYSLVFGFHIFLYKGYARYKENLLKQA